jgi:hypothetical protein
LVADDLIHRAALGNPDDTRRPAVTLMRSLRKKGATSMRLHSVLGIFLFALAFAAPSRAPAEDAPKPAAKPSPKHTPTAGGLGLSNRVAKAVELTPSQKDAILDVMARYEGEVEAVKKQNPFPKSGTQHDRELHLVRSDIAYSRLEDKYYGLVEKDVLTPEQLPAWHAYRIYFDATFPLNYVGVTREQGDQIKAMAKDVVSEIKPGSAKSAGDLYGKRKSRLQKRALAEVLTEEQRTKRAEMDAARAAIVREIEDADKNARNLPF